MTALLGVIRIGIDPILFHLGSLSIHWYGVMYAIAFLVALRFGAKPYLERHGLHRGQIDEMTIWTIVAGLIGARLYFVVQNNLGYYLHNPVQIIAVWEGGMAFYGAIVGSFIAIAILSWRYKISFWFLADAGALFAVIGQPIGRIGNIINGDILGAPSNLPWAMEYTNPNNTLVHALNVAYQPAALYEAIGTLCILAILFLLKRRGVRGGVLALIYVPAYAISQLILFQWRETEPVIAWGLKQAQLTSLVVLVIVFPLFFLLWHKTRPAKGFGAPSIAAP